MSIEDRALPDETRKAYEGPTLAPEHIINEDNPIGAGDLNGLIFHFVIYSEAPLLLADGVTHAILSRKKPIDLHPLTLIGDEMLRRIHGCIGVGPVYVCEMTRQPSPLNYCMIVVKGGKKIQRGHKKVSDFQQEVGRAISQALFGGDLPILQLSGCLTRCRGCKIRSCVLCEALHPAK